MMTNVQRQYWKTQGVQLQLYNLKYFDGRPFIFITMPNDGEMLHEKEKMLLYFEYSNYFTSAFILEQSLSHPEASFHTSYPSTSVLFSSSRNL